MVTGRLKRKGICTTPLNAGHIPPLVQIHANLFLEGFSHEKLRKAGASTASTLTELPCTGMSLHTTDSLHTHRENHGLCNLYDCYK